MRVAIIGATGNVGTSLIEELIADEDVDDIIGIARRPVSFSLPKVSWRQANVASDNLVQHFKGADIVIHLAWQLRPSHHFDQLHSVNVEGSKRVFQAAVEAGTKTVIYLSSVGAYSAGPKSPVDETHPTDGISSSTYGRHKSAVEHHLDTMETEHPDVRWVRMRPGLIFKRNSAEHIRRLFFGSLYPIFLLRKKPLPTLPDVPGLVVNAVHANDVAHAIHLAMQKDVRGAFNVAASDALNISTMAKIAKVPTISVSPKVLRAFADIAWRAHLQPTEAGWIDLALQTPLLDSTRAERELDWIPAFSAGGAFAELVEGLREGGNIHTPPLERAKTTGVKTAMNNGRILLKSRLR